MKASASHMTGRLLEATRFCKQLPCLCLARRWSPRSQGSKITFGFSLLFFGFLCFLSHSICNYGQAVTPL